MQVSATDTIPDQISDTIPDKQSDYYIGSFIPVDSSGNSFPDTITTSNLVYSRVYTNNVRFAGDPVSAKSFNSDFGFMVLSFSFILLAVLVISGRKSLFNTLSSLSLKRPFVLPVGGALGVLSWTPVLTDVFSMLSAALFLPLAGVMAGFTGKLPGFETIRLSSILFTGLMSALLLRYLICIITGSLSDNKNAFREYRTVISSVWFLAGVSFFLLSGTILFTSYQYPVHLVWVGAGIFILLYFYRIIRLLFIFIKQRVSILYFILYLCALEVLPVLIVIKLLGAF